MGTDSFLVMFFQFLVSRIFEKNFKNFFSVERYGTLENLNADLGNFLNHPLLPSGVKSIFTVDGEKVHTLDAVCNGGDFVAASRTGKRFFLRAARDSSDLIFAVESV